VHGAAQDPGGVGKRASPESQEELLRTTLQQAEQWAPELKQALDKGGWGLDRVSIEARKQRAVW
jgi:hypothetical protein